MLSTTENLLLLSFPIFILLATLPLLLLLPFSRCFLTTNEYVLVHSVGFMSVFSVFSSPDEVIRMRECTQTYRWLGPHVRVRCKGLLHVCVNSYTWSSHLCACWKSFHISLLGLVKVMVVVVVVFFFMPLSHFSFGPLSTFQTRTCGFTLALIHSTNTFAFHRNAFYKGIPYLIVCVCERSLSKHLSVCVN